MISQQDIIEKIYEDWGNNAQSEICISIFNHLLTLQFRNNFHLTYGSLRKALGTQFEDGEVLSAVQYLCGERTRLLDAKFELIEDESFYDLSDSEVRIARATGQLCHPETGELISDFEEKVLIYFQPSSLMKEFLLL